MLVNNEHCLIFRNFLVWLIIYCLSFSHVGKLHYLLVKKATPGDADEFTWLS